MTKVQHEGREYMQCCNMDERTNEEKLLDSNARLREENKQLKQHRNELLADMVAIRKAFNTLPRNEALGQMLKIAIEALAKAQGDKT
jgi:hypothetical protein